MKMLSKIRNAIRENGEYQLFHRIAITSWYWACMLCKFEDHWSLHFLCFWIRICNHNSDPPEEMIDKYGIEYNNEFSCLRLCWRNKSKYIHMPWSYDYYMTEVMLTNGEFVRHEQSWNLLLNQYQLVTNYQYTLRSGEIQNRIAIVTV